MLLLYLAKRNALLAVKKGQNFTHKNRRQLVHIVELSTALVKVDIKVINASLTQNQCLQCVAPPLTHAEIPRPRDTAEVNNDGIINIDQVRRRPLQNRTEFINFS